MVVTHPTYAGEKVTRGRNEETRKDERKRKTAKGGKNSAHGMHHTNQKQSLKHQLQKDKVASKQNGCFGSSWQSGEQ